MQHEVAPKWLGFHLQSNRGEFRKFEELRRWRSRLCTFRVFCLWFFANWYLCYSALMHLVGWLVQRTQPLSYLTLYGKACKKGQASALICISTRMRPVEILWNKHKWTWTLNPTAEGKHCAWMLIYGEQSLTFRTQRQCGTLSTSHWISPQKIISHC